MSDMQTVEEKGENPSQALYDEVETLIVGFGFSVIPLVRELDRTNTSYHIISDKNSVWNKMDRAGRVDFDLVSSYYTSFYSFDLVNDVKEDMYPTAQEFYAMHKRYFQQYKHKIEDNLVELIENYDNYSLVHTKDGRIYKAKNVVVSTGFKRRMLDHLVDFDCSVKDKTIAFTSIGDSANLLIAKLIPGNNKIICLQNGFVALDKMMTLNGTTFTLDQLEAHNFGNMFKRIYNQVVTSSIGSHVKIKNAIAKLFEMDYLAPFFAKHTMQTKFDTAREYSPTQIPTGTLPNGTIVIKYWPIDKYSEEFSNDLETAIDKGYLLNDIAYFINEKLVTLWSKKETHIDREKQTITWNGKTEHYDYLIDGDAEQPNLPKIIRYHDGGQEEFEYSFKECYYGLIPKKLKNIHLLGYTRPSTGGLANITEMQCLLAHKMLTDNQFNGEVYSNIAERIEAYNKKYSMTKEPVHGDHVVWYGFYTEDIARLIGIDNKLKDCKSIKEINDYFFFPNNTFKYRQKGTYKVEGCDKLVDYISKNHKNFALLHHHLFSYLLYRLLAFEASVLAYFENIISLPVLAVLLVVQFLFSKAAIIPVQNYFSGFKVSYLSAGAIAMLFIGSKTIIPILAADFAYTFYRRQKGFRYMFNDLKNKVKYHGFFKMYLSAYSSVMKKKMNVPEGMKEAKPEEPVM